MKIIYTTDLHGCPWKYNLLYETAQEYGAEVVVNGGDMLPNDEDMLTVQSNFIDFYLDSHFARFNNAGIHYLCCLGNDDLGILDEHFDTVCKKYPFVKNVSQSKVEIGDYEFIGMNWVVDYPFRLKDRCRMDTKDYTFQEQFGTGLISTLNGWWELSDWFSYAKKLPTIKEELDKLIRPVNMAQSIYIIHMPPSYLGLDVCANGLEVGSRAVYNFLKKMQPKLSIHGHIHESPEVSEKWQAALGRTVCIQPGQSKNLTYVTIDLENMQFERHVNGLTN